MFEQVEEARSGKGSKVLSEKEISKVLDITENFAFEYYTYFVVL